MQDTTKVLPYSCTIGQLTSVTGSVLTYIHLSALSNHKAVKVKAKLPLSTPRRRIGGVAVVPAAALILSLCTRRRLVVSFTPWPLYPVGTQWIEEWMYPTPGQDVSRKRQKSRLCRYSKPISSSPWPSHYTILIPIKIHLFSKRNHLRVCVSRSYRMVHENPSVTFQKTRRAKLCTGLKKNRLKWHRISLRLIDLGSSVGIYNASVTPRRQG